MHGTASVACWPASVLDSFYGWGAGWSPKSIVLLPGHEVGSHFPTIEHQLWTDEPELSTNSRTKITCRVWHLEYAWVWHMFLYNAQQTHTYNPSTWKVKAKELKVQGLPQLQSLRPVWDTWDLVSKEQQQRKERLLGADTSECSRNSSTSSSRCLSAHAYVHTWDPWGGGTAMKRKSGSPNRHTRESHCLCGNPALDGSWKIDI